MIHRVFDAFGITGRDCGVPPPDASLPKARRDDDIFLVSYPKSGNTWISFILANMMVEKLHLDLEVNLFNIRGLIPDIHMGRELPLDMGFFPFKRMIKSHAEFNPFYLNVFYIIRDPRSVMVSYHKFLTGLGQFKGDLGSLIRNDALGVSAWKRHVNDWLDNIKPSTRFRLFRYEDFKSGPEENTRIMARLLGVHLSDGELRRVLDRSSFENMQDLEKQTGSFPPPACDKNFKFMREGKVDGWRQELAEEDLAFIREVAGATMTRFGYR